MDGWVVDEWVDGWTERWVDGTILTKGHFSLFTAKADSHAIFPTNALFKLPLLLRNQKLLHKSIDRCGVTSTVLQRGWKAPGESQSCSNQRQ